MSRFVTIGFSKIAIEKIWCISLQNMGDNDYRITCYPFSKYHGNLEEFHIFYPTIGERDTMFRQLAYTLPPHFALVGEQYINLSQVFYIEKAQNEDWFYIIINCYTKVALSQNYSSEEERNKAFDAISINLPYIVKGVDCFINTDYMLRVSPYEDDETEYKINVMFEYGNEIDIVYYSKEKRDMLVERLTSE